MPNMKFATIFALLIAVSVCIAQNPGRGGAARGNANTMVGLLGRADVRAELKLTPEQIAAIEAANPRGQGRRGQGQAGGAGQGAGDAEAMRRARTEREASTMKVLSEPQQKRLQELFIQRVGARAVMVPQVGQALGITQEQTAQMRQLQQRQREANQAVMERARSGEIDRAQAREAQAKNEAALEAEMRKLLSPAQQEKLREMAGAPFTFRDE